MPKLPPITRVVLWDMGNIQTFTKGDRLIKPLCGPPDTERLEAIAEHSDDATQFATGTSMTQRLAPCIRWAFWGHCGPTAAGIREREMQKDIEQADAGV